jgi:DNA-binding transcriptional ArsR family regulator
LLGDTFKALTDKTRREILLMLRNGEMTAGEIAEKFATRHATVSHHLKILKDAKLVSVERKGQNIIYSLNSTVFQDIMAWLMNFND